MDEWNLTRKEARRELPKKSKKELLTIIEQLLNLLERTSNVEIVVKTKV